MIFSVSVTRRHFKQYILTLWTQSYFLPINMKIEGFLPALTVLPALGVGALSGLASTGVQKLIGSGLYLKKGGCMCQIETDGSGLYLGPTSSKGFEIVGNGLYLMKQDGLYDDRGLILGPNSPFKKYPHS